MCVGKKRNEAVYQTVQHTLFVDHIEDVTSRHHMNNEAATQFNIQLQGEILKFKAEVATLKGQFTSFEALMKNQFTIFRNIV